MEADMTAETQIYRSTLTDRVAFAKMRHVPVQPRKRAERAIVKPEIDQICT